MEHWSPSLSLRRLSSRLEAIDQSWNYRRTQFRLCKLLQIFHKHCSTCEGSNFAKVLLFLGLKYRMLAGVCVTTGDHDTEDDAVIASVHW